jgi:hypothetical protein
MEAACSRVKLEPVRDNPCVCVLVAFEQRKLGCPALVFPSRKIYA